MISAFLLCTMLSPAAPVPKSARPAGPPPKLVLLKSRNGSVTLSIMETVTTKQVLHTENAVNGQQKIVTKDVQTTRYVLKSLEQLDVKFAMVSGDVMPWTEVGKAADAGVVVAFSGDGEEIDPIYRNMFKPGTIVATGSDCPRIATNTSRIPSAPQFQTVKFEGGSVRLAAYPFVENPKPAPVPAPAGGIPVKPVIRATLSASGPLTPMTMAELKPAVTKAGGTAVASADAEALIGKNTVVLTSALEAGDCQNYLAAFKDDVLFVSAPQFARGHINKVVGSNIVIATPVVPPLIVPVAPAPAK